MNDEIVTLKQETENAEAVVNTDAIANMEKSEDDSSETKKKSRRRKVKKAEVSVSEEGNEKPESKESIQTGDVFETKLILLYHSSAAPKHYKGISGRFYIWDNKVVDGRIRITDSQSGIGNLKGLIGWVNLADIIK